MNIGMPNTAVVHIGVPGILWTGCIVTELMQLLRSAMEVDLVCELLDQ